MSRDLSSLTEDHVRQLGRIVETLEKSTFDYLQLEVGDLKITVGKGNMTVPEPSAPAAQPAVSGAPAPQAAVAAAPAQQPAPSASAQAGTVEIKSPIMGMFYGQPEPGAAAFVEVGSMVSEDTTVALVEVMKTFNAVSAGVRGKVAEICAQNAQLVEYGQVLFRVVPE